MKFTYDAYCRLISLMQASGYVIKNYHNYSECPKCVILRHDIDTSISAAVCLAEVEAKIAVSSTYFVLLRTDFYNPASATALTALKYIQSLGHDIGLHFDEKAYPKECNVPAAILREAEILSSILETTVSTVSMHRPSKKTLDSDYQIPCLVNSYGRVFFKDFKYLSDSRCTWREPIEEIIQSGQYDRLQVLTHPIWYGIREQSIEQTIQQFVNGANQQRYITMRDNITNLGNIMSESQVHK